MEKQSDSVQLNNQKNRKEKKERNGKERKKWKRKKETLVHATACTPS